MTDRSLQPVALFAAVLAACVAAGSPVGDAQAGGSGGMQPFSRFGGQAIAEAAQPAVSAQQLFPPMEGIVANNSSIEVSEERISSEFAERVGEPYNLDGAVVLSRSCQPDPEVWLDLALREYGLADRAGEINNDTVAWLVCEDPRFVGFFYSGDNPYADRFDSDAVADAMVDDLQASNFTGAITSGLDVVADDLAGAAERAPAGVPGDSEAAAGPGPGAGAEAAAGAGQAPTAEDSADSGRGWGPYALAGALLGVGGYMWWYRRKKKREASAGADAGAATGAEPVPGPVHEMEAKLAQLDERLTEDSTPLAQLILAYEPLGEEAMLEVSRRHEAMLARLGQLHETASEIDARVTATQPTDEVLAELYEAPLAEADELLEYVTDLETESEHVAMLEDKAPVLAVEARKTIDAMHERYEAERLDLELPPTAAAFAFAVSLADAAEGSLTDGQRITAGRLAEDANAIADSTGRLPGEMHAVLKAVDEAGTVFPRLEAYAESSWADVRGNGSEAEESLDAAADMFERTVAAQPTDFGTDEAAGYLESLEAVFDELARARRLVAAIDERLSFLRRAEEEAGKAIADVERDIADARTWITGPDVDPHVSEERECELDRAAAQLEAARQAMREEKPDWTMVLRTANAADRAADDALADARAEHEAHEARRRALAGASSEAEAAVDRAVRYLAAHRRDASSHAAEHVSDARVELQRASEKARVVDGLEESALTAALAAATAGYLTARETADAAYDQMSSDVAKADERRRGYAPRPDWMGPMVPIPMNMRPFPFPSQGSSRARSSPARKSSWGSRPSRKSRRVGGSGSRRGGGRGW